MELELVERVLEVFEHERIEASSGAMTQTHGNVQRFAAREIGGDLVQVSNRGCIAQIAAPIGRRLTIGDESERWAGEESAAGLDRVRQRDRRVDDNAGASVQPGSGACASEFDAPGGRINRLAAGKPNAFVGVFDNRSGKGSQIGDERRWVEFGRLRLACVLSSSHVVVQASHFCGKPRIAVGESALVDMVGREFAEQDETLEVRWTEL